MYLPPAFREEDPEALHRLIRDHPFATLVSGSGADLEASHIPLLLDPHRGLHGTLQGHVARANPQWQQFTRGEEVLAIFHGPHAYISPAWYETELAVPTWNYAVVHAYGTVELVEDEERGLQMLEELVRTFEAGRPEPWSTSGLPGEWLRKVAHGIVAFEIPISRLEGKFKLGQNRSEADQQRVLYALAASDHAEDRKLASLQHERRESRR